MTSKKALSNIKYIDLHGRYPYPYYLKDDLEYKESIEILEELVNRDTPMKPLLVEVSTDNVHHYVCSYCNATINIGGTISYNKAFNIFCRECGQRLDWSE